MCHWVLRKPSHFDFFHSICVNVQIVLKCKSSIVNGKVTQKSLTFKKLKSLQLIWKSWPWVWTHLMFTLSLQVPAPETGKRKASRAPSPWQLEHSIQPEKNQTFHIISPSAKYPRHVRQTPLSLSSNDFIGHCKDPSTSELLRITLFSN